MGRKGFIVAFIFIHVCGIAQRHAPDSLRQLIYSDKEDTSRAKRLTVMCEYFFSRGSYDSAIYYVDRSLALVDKKAMLTRGARGDLFRRVTATVNVISGNIHLTRGNYEEALENYFTALKASNELGDKKISAISIDNIGNVYYAQGDYDKALENFFAALKIREEIFDRKGLAGTYNNIANVYFELKNYDKALENDQASLQIKNELGDKHGVVTSLNNIATIYDSKKNYEKALENYFAALKLSEEIGQTKTPDYITALNNIGNCYQDQGNYEKALDQYLVAIRLGEETSYQKGIVDANMNIGSLYKHKKDYPSALNYLQKSLALSRAMGAKSDVMGSYQELAETYSLMKDYKKAYEHYQAYSAIRDSIYNENSERDIAEMQTKYETDKKEKKIEIQSLKISEQELQLGKDRIFQAFLFACIFFILILGYLLFNRHKIKKDTLFKARLLEQQKRHTQAIIETQEQERTRIARDLHDGIGQRMAGIIANFEQLMSDTTVLSEEKQKKFKQTARYLDEAHKELRTISHQMMPRALKVAGLSPAISDLLDKTLAGTNIQYHFEMQPLEGISENISISVYRIFQELLGNILKHSRATKVSVQLFKNHDSLFLIVEDNGVGIPKGNKEKPGKTSRGIGMMNMTARAEAMRGTFLIEPASSGGTVATIIIPLRSSHV